jgi:hypothetical protein
MTKPTMRQAFVQRASMLMLLGLTALSSAGCKSAGMGDNVRTDVTARMQAAQAPFAECYKTALQGNRRLRGYIVLSFVAEASTGKFAQARTMRDEPGNPAFTQCVIAEVEKLKLEKPQSTNVLIDYPLSFQPSN